jgi:hypothetical protein
LGRPTMAMIGFIFYIRYWALWVKNPGPEGQALGCS